MDAFPNITQVYLQLSPSLSLHMSSAFEDGFISIPGLHHALFTLGIDIEDECILSPVFLCPNVSCSQMASRQTLWAVLDPDPAMLSIYMISRVVSQETGLPVLDPEHLSTWPCFLKGASLFELSGQFEGRHSSKYSGNLLQGFYPFVQSHPGPECYTVLFLGALSSIIDAYK